MPAQASITWLEFLTAVASIATPILLAILTGVGWLIQQRFDRLRKVEEESRERYRMIEERLREDRLKIYDDLIEPYVLLFTRPDTTSERPDSAGKSRQQVATEMMLSERYRRTAFRLMLFANDSVARSYNSLMQAAFQGAQLANTQGNGSNKPANLIIDCLAAFLLEVRKSVGNESTKLDRLEMLEFFITDITKLREQVTPAYK